MIDDIGYHALTGDLRDYDSTFLGGFMVNARIFVQLKMEDLLTLCNDELYAELVGSLMYAAVGSRPDLTHTVSVLSQFTT